MEKKSPSAPFLQFSELIKRLWVPAAGFISAVSLIVQFIELWRGDQNTVTWVIVTLGIIVFVFVLSWVGYSSVESSVLPPHRSLRYPRFYRLARLGLLLFLIAGAGLGYFLYQRIQQLNNTVIILVSNFDGPNPKTYRVTEIIWENLNTAFISYDNVKLILDNNSIKSVSEAEEEGGKHNASIVIWGWYGLTDQKVSISIHFDILKEPAVLPQDFLDQQAIQYFDITQFDSFVLQDQLSDQMAFLSLMTVGLARYSTQDWDGAISSFNDAYGYTSNQELLQQTKIFIELSKAYDSMSFISPQAGKTIVLAVSENIPQGSIIRADQLIFYQIPSDIAVDVMITRPEDVLGKYTKYPLERGVVITTFMLVNSLAEIDINAAPAWSSIISESKWAITIPVNNLWLTLTADPNTVILQLGTFSIETPSPTPLP